MDFVLQFLQVVVQLWHTVAQLFNLLFDYISIVTSKHRGKSIS